jgi:hypothetical protein
VRWVGVARSKEDARTRCINALLGIRGGSSGRDGKARACDTKELAPNALLPPASSRRPGARSRAQFDGAGLGCTHLSTTTAGTTRSRAARQAFSVIGCRTCVGLVMDKSFFRGRRRRGRGVLRRCSRRTRVLWCVDCWAVLSRGLGGSVGGREVGGRVLPPVDRAPPSPPPPSPPPLPSSYSAPAPVHTHNTLSHAQVKTRPTPLLSQRRERTSPPAAKKTYTTTTLLDHLRLNVTC